MKAIFDLHIHSEYSSDGCMTLDEIVRYAKAAGLNGVAVCDHGRVLSPPIPEFPDFLIIPGVEIATQYGHLLGLFVTEPINETDYADAVTSIRAQGGLAVLAHPFERTRDPYFCDDAASMTDGAEVFNARAERKNPAANRMAEDLAERFRLARFAGSDAHLPQEIGHGTVTLEVEHLTLDCVRDALKNNEREIAGRRSPARYTAFSQWIRRKKAHAGLLSRLKWALFAAKCLAQDLVYPLTRHGKEDKNVTDR